MSKINQIQQAIVALSPGAYQKLMDEYLVKKYHFDNIAPYGSHTGTDKTTQGTPDSYVRCDDGKYIFIAHGSVGKAFQKVKEDIIACLDPDKTGIKMEDIKQIICCHTSTNFSAKQTSELYALFDNIIIIGLGDVSYDLLNKYQAIAYDHLHIALDTHQFFDLDGFIKEYSKNAYSTSLDMPLLCRENDLAKLKEAIATDNVIMLFGASGVGKTHLAIEAARQYTISQNANMLVLKSNGESIYSDCSSYIDDEQEHIIVVDDANELKQIGHLISLAKDTDRTHSLKLILTVRDYARNSLSTELSEVCKPVSIEVSALTNENIENILKESFKIANRSVLDQIIVIAKGNARLAVMAANCVVAGRFDSIANASDLFDGYYAPIISQLDQKELLVASLIAFFDAISLNESALPIILANGKGVPRSQFIDYCKSLHQKEVVNLLDNRAVRFDNQNLRDYLLNYLFLQSKVISLSEMIDVAFPKYRQRIVFVFSTLWRLFNTPENVNYIEQQIREAWKFIKLRDEETVRRFVETFSVAIPDETLIYLKKQIEGLEEIKKPCSMTNYKSAPNPKQYYSPIVKLLLPFKQYDCFEDALELLIRLMEHNNENPTDFYLLFGDAWSFEYRSFENGFKQEQIIIDELLDYYRKLPSDRSALCLYAFIKESLKFNFSCTEETDARSLRIINFHLPPCNEVYAIRAKCIQGLSLLFASSVHQEWALQILYDVFQGGADENDKLILRKDIEVFSAAFADVLTAENLFHCQILKRVQTVCEHNDIAYPSSLPSCESNSIYKKYSVLAENYIFKYHELDNSDHLRKHDIETLCESTTADEFGQLWQALSMPPLNGNRNDWDIGSGIDLVFGCLRPNKEKFMACVDSYLNCNTPFALHCDQIMDGLIQWLGHVESEQFLLKFDFGAKYQWIAKIQNRIPADRFDKDTCERILSCLDLPPELIEPVNFETVQTAEQVVPGFALQYLSILNRKVTMRPYLLSNFLFPLSRDSVGEIDLLLQQDGAVDILVDSYILALRGRQFFDYTGDLLLALSSRSRTVIPLVVSEIITNRHSMSEMPYLTALWRADNYLELITEAIEAVFASDRYSGYTQIIGKELITKATKSKDSSEKLSAWLTKYISTHGNEVKRIKFLFGILCNCHKDVFMNALLIFCQVNRSVEDFKKIRLAPTSRSWSGSEIPLIDKQLEFLDGLRTQLKGIDFAEHRAWISEWIDDTRKYRASVESEEFVDRT